MKNDLRIEIRARNNILYRAIYDDYENVSQFSRQFGISQSTVGNLLNLKKQPVGVKGYLPQCIKIAECLGYTVSKLFPLHLYNIEIPFRILEVSMSDLSIGSEELNLLVDKRDYIYEVESEMLRDDLIKDMNRLLHTLTIKERTLLRLRYGLEDEVEHTYGEISKKMNVSIERCRQLICKAIRKLQHPVRARKLEKFLENN